MNDIQQYLKNLFLKNNNYVSQEGELLIYKIVEDARLQTKDLIKFLMSDKECKKMFFEKIDDITIFKSEEFRICINDARFLGNSFTRYLNKIGLMNNYSESMIMNEDYVVLNYPYKDCTLDGGMTKEESKRINKKETMINNILFKKDIHKLKSPKVLKNFIKFNLIESKIKENEVKQLTGKENILINGNNFAALCSLRKKFAGKIKLIYIDPPYNTGNDTFSYNDNFNHSTWLVFMKDRLKIAKDLLREDGVIFVQCDDNEQAYLKVLMDEIFGRGNFVGCIVWLKGNTQNDANTLQKNHEYILCYAKNMETNPIYRVKQKVEVKIFKDEKTQKFYYEGYGLVSGSATGGRLENRPSLGYSIYYNPQTKDFLGVLDYDKELARDNTKHNDLYKDDLNLINKGYEIIRPPKLGAGLRCWTWALDKFNNNKDEILIKKTKNGYSVLTKKYIDNREVKQNEKGEYYAIVEKENPPKSFIDSIASGVGTTHVKEIFGDKVFNNPKSEKMLQRIIEISTQEGDLIMDFFAGSGTTLAVAHKMKRQYIGVEQIERHFDICVERLKKVIEGEQGGISKTVNWKGGGEFIRCDIATYNANWIEKINKVKSDKEFKELFNEMKEKSVINHRLKIDYFETDNLLDKDFNGKDLEEKKSIMLEILDKNMFYVPFSERHDTNFKISDNDIKLSESFYER